MPAFVKVARADEFSAGIGKLVEVAGKQVALFRVNDTCYAIDNTCTHLGGPLCEGEVQGTTVECPWHGAQFSLETGKVLRAPAQADVASYPVRQQGEDIEIEI